MHNFNISICYKSSFSSLQTSAVPIFHLGSPRKTDPTKCQVSFGKLRKKIFFGGLGGVRFPGPSKVANCQSVEDCKK